MIFKSLFQRKVKSHALIQPERKKIILFRQLFSYHRSSNLILKDLERMLILSDMKISMVQEILEKIQKNNRYLKSFEHLQDFIREFLSPSVLERSLNIEKGLNIILLFGINGVGKTTTAVKLASFFKKQDLDIILAAADTYRSGAVEQLEEWVKEINIRLIKNKDTKVKSSAVVFDALDAALAKNTEVLIIDSSGRLHNKDHLMNELEKIKRVIQMKTPNAKLYNIVVLDSTLGQNSFHQLEQFHQLMHVDGIILTKYDISSKKGIVFSASRELQIPVFFIACGESINDLKKFSRDQFLADFFS